MPPPPPPTPPDTLSPFSSLSRAPRGAAPPAACPPPSGGGEAAETARLRSHRTSMGDPALRFRQAERTRQPDQRSRLPGPAYLRLIAENLVGPRRFADGGQGYRRPHIRTVLAPIGRASCRERVCQYV